MSRLPTTDLWAVPGGNGIAMTVNDFLEQIGPLRVWQIIVAWFILDTIANFVWAFVQALYRELRGEEKR